MIFLILLLLIGIPCGKVQAKYRKEEETILANIQIDQTKPTFEILEIKNSNSFYPTYVSKKHTVEIKMNILEKNREQMNMNQQWIDVIVGQNKILPENFKITLVKEEVEKVECIIQLKGIPGDGKLQIKIKEGAIVDKTGLINDLFEIDTGIMVDNINPIVEFREEKLTNGKVNAVLTANEKLAIKKGWEIAESKKEMKKEFTNNVSYQVEVEDYAQNTSQVMIYIQSAIYINLSYCSHNSTIGWSYGYGNYDIAGRDAVLKNPIYKTEALGFHIDGNIPDDFIQARAFVHTYWGIGREAICESSHMKYSYGYNPSKSLWKSMNSKDLVNLNGKQYFQFGGSGMNLTNKTDINGNNPIPYEQAEKFLYGISGIQMKLKDESYYSIVYQIYVCNKGWLEPAFDGKETRDQNSKPFSAFRMTLIPKTEREAVVNMWKKEVGTNDMGK